MPFPSETLFPAEGADTGAILLDEQFETGGLIFGKDTPWVVTGVDFGTSEVRRADTSSARSDGRRFSKWYRSGQTIKFDITVCDTEQESVWELAEQFKEAWAGDEVRFTPGATRPLRWRIDGRDRMTTGRPLPLSEDNSLWGVGQIRITADFETNTHLCYGPPREIRVGMVPPSTGGLTFPVSMPRVFTQGSQVFGLLDINGRSPSWLEFELHGPTLNPTIEVISQWQVGLAATLASDRWVTLRGSDDPQQRTVELDDGTNWASKLTNRSQWLSKLRLWPGEYTLRLWGQDPTASSHLFARWRDAFPLS